MTKRLSEAIKQLELRGARVATQAADDGIGSDLAKVLDAARRFASLTSPETISDAEMKELARFSDDLRCHYDQKEKVHYIGLWKKTDVAPRVVLTALKLLRAVLRSVEEGKT